MLANRRHGNLSAISRISPPSVSVDVSVSTNWESTIERLDTARSQWWLYGLLCGLVLAISIALLALLIVVAMDVGLELSLRVRVALFWAWCITSLGLIGAAILRSLRYQRTRYAAARRIEAAYPQVENDLINLVQLTESSGGGSESFRQAALSQASFRTTFVPIDKVAAHYPRRIRWRLALHGPRDLVETVGLLVIVVVLFSVLGALVPRWWSSVDRVLGPTQETQTVHKNER